MKPCFTQKMKLFSALVSQGAFIIVKDGHGVPIQVLCVSECTNQVLKLTHTVLRHGTG